MFNDFHKISIPHIYGSGKHDGFTLSNDQHCGDALSSKRDTKNGTPLPVQKSSPVAIAKLKGSVGLNDPGQRELLKLCLSLTLAWFMVHGPSWSNSCSFMVLHVQNEMCGRVEEQSCPQLRACEANSPPRLTKPPSQLSYKVSCTSMVLSLFRRRVGNCNHHVCLLSIPRKCLLLLIVLQNISNLRTQISHLLNK